MIDAGLRDAVLARWNGGGRTYREIAAELGISHGSVAGIINRARSLGAVPPRRSMDAPTRTPKRSAAGHPGGVASTPSTPSPAVIAPHVHAQKAGRARTPSSRCQFIAGEPSADDACKCRKRARGGGPYCAEHHAVCYVTVTRQGGGNIDDWNRKRAKVITELAMAIGTPRYL